MRIISDDSIEGMLAELQKEINTLKDRADIVVAERKFLKEYIPYTDKKFDWNLYNSNQYGSNFNKQTEYFFYKGSSYNKPNITKEMLEKVLSNFDSTTEQWVEDNKGIKSENEEICKHNIEQCDKIRVIMKEFGIRDNYSTFDYKSSRSRKKTETKRSAGYISDLNRICPADSSYKVKLGNIKSKRSEIEKYGLAKIKETQELKAKEEKELVDQKKNQMLSALRVKYTPDNYLSSEDDLLEAILSGDKYLNLAHYLSMNRGDWSDGYNYAIYGLSKFHADTELDKLIEQEIGIICANEDVDGRYFRDCTYSYDVLFGMANKVLFADYSLCCECVDLF